MKGLTLQITRWNWSPKRWDAFDHHITLAHCMWTNGSIVVVPEEARLGKMGGRHSFDRFWSVAH